MSTHKIAQYLLVKNFALRHVKGHHQPRTVGDDDMKALFCGQRKLRWPFPEGEESLREQPLGQSNPSNQGCEASCWYSSRLTESAGRLSKGRLKRATLWPRHLVCGAGAVGDSK